jgi:hypothetical protein
MLTLLMMNKETMRAVESGFKYLAMMNASLKLSDLQSHHSTSWKKSRLPESAFRFMVRAFPPKSDVYSVNPEDCRAAGIVHLRQQIRRHEKSRPTSRTTTSVVIPSERGNSEPEEDIDMT